MTRLRPRSSPIKVLAALAAFSAFAPVWAQPPKPDDKTARAPAADDIRLDELLSAKNYVALAQTLRSAPVDRRMAWLRDCLLKGNTAFLGFPYITDLWQAGSVMRTDDPDKDLRVVAGLFVLYTYALVAIDGAKCEDASAPGHRVTSLARFHRRSWLT